VIEREASSNRVLPPRVFDNPENVSISPEAYDKVRSLGQPKVF
jgi:hypothetical protein